MWPEDAPSSISDYRERAENLLVDTSIRFAVLEDDFERNVDQLRIVAGDILSDKAFEDCNRPFGTAGNSKERIPRKPSPLKLRAAFLDGGLRLVAVWDGRHQGPDDLQRGVAILASANKPLGRLLEPALPQLIG